jgi:hypothetical protein
MIFYLTEHDDIFTPFKYKFVQINDNNPLTNNQLYKVLIKLQVTNRNITDEDLKNYPELTPLARETLKNINMIESKNAAVYCTDILRTRHHKPIETDDEIPVGKMVKRQNFIFIDSRCVKTIFYITLLNYNVMIYNVDNNKIETFLQYINQRFFANNDSYTVSDYNTGINMLFIYLFIRYFCKSFSINYNQNEIKNTIDRFKHFNNGELRVDEPNYIDVEILCEYVKKIKKRDRNFNPQTREINIHQRIMIQDSIKPFPKISTDELLMELENYRHNCKLFILSP